MLPPPMLTAAPTFLPPGMGHRMVMAAPSTAKMALAAMLALFLLSLPVMSASATEDAVVEPAQVGLGEVCGCGSLLLAACALGIAKGGGPPAGTREFDLEAQMFDGVTMAPVTPPHMHDIGDAGDDIARVPGRSAGQDIDTRFSPDPDPDDAASDAHAGHSPDPDPSPADLAVNWNPGEQRPHRACNQP